MERLWPAVFAIRLAGCATPYGQNQSGDATSSIAGTEISQDSPDFSCATLADGFGCADFEGKDTGTKVLVQGVAPCAVVATNSAAGEQSLLCQATNVQLRETRKQTFTLDFELYLDGPIPASNGSAIPIAEFTFGDGLSFGIQANAAGSIDFTTKTDQPATFPSGMPAKDWHHFTLHFDFTKGPLKVNAKADGVLLFNGTLASPAKIASWSGNIAPALAGYGAFIDNVVITP